MSLHRKQEAPIKQRNQVSHFYLTIQGNIKMLNLREFPVCWDDNKRLWSKMDQLFHDHCYRMNCVSPKFLYGRPNPHLYLETHFCCCWDRVSWFLLAELLEITHRFSRPSWPGLLCHAQYCLDPWPSSNLTSKVRRFLLNTPSKSHLTTELIFSSSTSPNLKLYIYAPLVSSFITTIHPKGGSCLSSSLVPIM